MVMIVMTSVVLCYDTTHSTVLVFTEGEDEPGEVAGFPLFCLPAAPSSVRPGGDWRRQGDGLLYCWQVCSHFSGLTSVITQVNIISGSLFSSNINIISPAFCSFIVMLLCHECEIPGPESRILLQCCLIG